MRWWKAAPLLLLVACGDSTGIDAARAELEAQYSAWQKLGITSYDFVFQQLCFCPPESTRPAVLQVRAGVLVAALDSVGQPIPATKWYTYKTIDEIFQLLIQHAAAGRVMKNLAFDPELHYPTHANSDIEGAVDAGYEIRASNLMRSPPITQLPQLTRDTSAAIQMDSIRYQLQAGPLALQVTLRYALRNRTKDTVLLQNCNGAYDFTLYMQVDGRWERAYSPILPACLSPPITIAAGSTFTDTLSIISGYTLNNLYPKFFMPYPEGVYQLAVAGFRSHSFILDDPRND